MLSGAMQAQEFQPSASGDQQPTSVMRQQEADFENLKEFLSLPNQTLLEENFNHISFTAPMNLKSVATVTQPALASTSGTPMTSLSVQTTAKKSSGQVMARKTSLDIPLSSQREQLHQLNSASSKV